MVNTKLIVVILVSAAAVIDACLPSNSPCLNGVESEPLTSGSNGQPVPVTDPSILSCDFNGPCCWADNLAGSEELEAQVVTDPGQLTTCFPALIPSGNFYSIYGKNLVPHPNAEAELESCPIACTEPGSTTDVTVKAFKSAGSVLEACTRSESGQLQNCQRYTAPNGVPQTFNLPSGENYQVVLKASGFNTAADFINIESIDVDAVPCPEPTTTTTTTTTTTPEPTTPTTPTTTEPARIPGEELCQKVKCDFIDGDLCQWQTSSAASGTTFKPYEAGSIVGNLDTGVNALADNNPNPSMPQVSDTGFAASPLTPGDKVEMMINDLDLQEDMILKFKAYEAAQNQRIRACFDGACEDVTDLDIRIQDRQWRDVEVLVPRQTRQLKIVGEMTKDYYGAVGLMDFQVVDPVTGDTVQC